MTGGTTGSTTRRPCGGGSLRAGGQAGGGCVARRSSRPCSWLAERGSHWAQQHATGPQSGCERRQAGPHLWLCRCGCRRPNGWLTRGIAALVACRCRWCCCCCCCRHGPGAAGSRADAIMGAPSAFARARRPSKCASCSPKLHAKAQLRGDGKTLPPAVHPSCSRVSHSWAPHVCAPWHHSLTTAHPPTPGSQRGAAEATPCRRSWRSARSRPDRPSRPPGWAPAQPSAG